jgi:1,2-dihydroxy-3-keto-5-methylthiopentene dioxygenase
MAIVTIPDENRTITETEEIKQYLASIDIDYEQWQPAQSLPAAASADEVLAAYADDINRLKELDGYVTADVIDVLPTTPGLDAMLAKFKSEHWHDDDEVRFIIEGRGIFHIHPPNGAVTAIEVTAGDLIRVPGGTLHWFNLCEDMRIRAIRLFIDPTGWVPRYTESGMDSSYQPLCFGASYLPAITVPAQ